MDGQKNQGTKPADQPNEEFIEDQPNRREQKEHSSDPMRSQRDSADDRGRGHRDDDEETDDLQEGVDDIEREED